MAGRPWALRLPGPRRGRPPVVCIVCMHIAATCIMCNNTNKGMPLIQVRDVPDNIYRLLAERARLERRSIAQQVLATLARGLGAEMDPKSRRRTLLDGLGHGASARWAGLKDPVKLIREDRLR